MKVTVRDRTYEMVGENVVVTTGADTDDPIKVKVPINDWLQIADLIRKEGRAK